MCRPGCEADRQLGDGHGSCEVGTVTAMARREVTQERRLLASRSGRWPASNACGSDTRSVGRSGSAARRASTIRCRARSTAGSGSGTAESSACVYGWRGLRVELGRGRGLDDLAEVHDRDPVGDVAHDREVVADEQVGEAAARSRRSASRFSTWAWIDTSSALTGSSSTTRSGCTERARAIARRWRWPPENSCG